MDITQVEKANEEVAALRAQRDKDYAEYEAAGRVGFWSPGSGSLGSNFLASAGKLSTVTYPWRT